MPAGALRWAREPRVPLAAGAHLPEKRGTGARMRAEAFGEREDQLVFGAAHTDEAEPAFLQELLLLLALVVGHVALLQTEHKDRRPLQTLRLVKRGDLD